MLYCNTHESKKHFSLCFYTRKVTSLWGDLPIGLEGNNIFIYLLFLLFLLLLCTFFLFFWFLLNLNHKLFDNDIDTSHYMTSLYLTPLLIFIKSLLLLFWVIYLSYLICHLPFLSNFLSSFFFSSPHIIAFTVRFIL